MRRVVSRTLAFMARKVGLAMAFCAPLRMLDGIHASPEVDASPEPVSVSNSGPSEVSALKCLRIV